MADPAERPHATWPLLFFFWWPALANRWRDHGAPVRAFELTAHGLREALAAGRVLRVQHQRVGGPGFEAVNVSRVTVLDVGKSWRADAFATEAW
jgi:hypothetical protein